MNNLVPSLALLLIGGIVTAALVAGIVARATLVDATGSDGHILVFEFLGIAAGLALIVWGLMSSFAIGRRRPQA